MTRALIVGFLLVVLGGMAYVVTVMSGYAVEAPRLEQRPSTSSDVGSGVPH